MIIGQFLIHGVISLNFSAVLITNYIMVDTPASLNIYIYSSVGMFFIDLFYSFLFVQFSIYFLADPDFEDSNQNKSIYMKSQLNSFLNNSSLIKSSMHIKSKDLNNLESIFTDSEL